MKEEDRDSYVDVHQYHIYYTFCKWHKHTDVRGAGKFWSNANS